LWFSQTNPTGEQKVHKQMVDTNQLTTIRIVIDTA
jgi:hypothetical protein